MINNFSFFIYDYESFGINPASDRPAQFAGIRTDADFNIIGEPVMLYCKQTNDYLPAPEAVIVTGITPQECNEKGIPEPEFAAKILAEFSQPNTCVMGYNNIRYDDEMTRYTFYRNFIDPYGKMAILVGIYWIWSGLAMRYVQRELIGLMTMMVCQAFA